MKKWLALFMCVMLLLAVTACNREPVQPVEDPVETAPTTEPTENTGLAIGGDENGCTVHSLDYHTIPSNFRAYDIEEWKEVIRKDKEEGKYNESSNIVNFVEYFDITRSEFIEAMRWDTEDLNARIDYKDGHRYCPYTYNQFLDAIYGDDEELAEWVFANEDTWPEIEETAE